MIKRIALFLALLLVFSCGKGTEGDRTETAKGHGAPGDAGTEPVAMIPDSGFSEFENMVGAYIRPYFDVDGTVAATALEPGEMFDIYVFAEFKEGFPMAGAEYRLDLPEGVVVLSTVHTDSVVITMGKWDVDFMITFRCLPGPKHWLVRYVCKATDEFQSGTVATGKGKHLNFLGFTMCDAQASEVRGRPGTAVLERK